MTNRIVKLAFYRAALASGLPKPEWGSLSGVRPAKLVDAYLREGLSPARGEGALYAGILRLGGAGAGLCLDAALAAREAERSLEAQGRLSLCGHTLSARRAAPIAAS